MIKEILLFASVKDRLNSESFLFRSLAFMRYKREKSEEQTLKVGRIRPHGGRWRSCIIGLWFRDGIYKACSTWQVRLPPSNSPNRHLGWRGTRHYRYDIYTGNAVNAFLGFLIEKYCVDSALKWQSIVLLALPFSLSLSLFLLVHSYIFKI